MKKLLIAAISLFTIGLNAQQLEKSLLWKISGNGIKEPSYIFGTIHVTCDATLDEHVIKALNDTRQLYLELDMDDPAMKAGMMGGMMMKDGVTLDSLATTEDLAVLDAFITKELGIPLKMMNRFKPSMISMSLMPKYMDCPMQSFEEELMKVTHEQKEEVYGLETLEEQLAVFDDISYEEQMNELLKTAKDGIEKDKAEFDKMQEVYRTKDLNAIMKFMADSENKMYGDNADVLLNNRNKNWIPKIDETAKQSPTFFGVGAAHLGGKEGVIMLLRKKGYKVEAVK
ncbi:TraB/GumN family protein [Flavobacterium beibuense]|uniref:GumN family protein n=1 Tax=Flavobacterium beibuense TaxID=657326 RepID=A0A444W8X4_9FLAO|nr:TraB/GumN family protein [Flavobacterium beibuense]RYJ42314.1 GumN family protein [Flavobacterium beibuense]